jgi:MFS transporter, ACS family, D-galactonate transporter
MSATEQHPTATPDLTARVPRRRWLVTGLVLVITTVAFVDRVNLSVAAPVLIREFGTNAAVMGLLLSSFSWSYTLLNLPAGRLVDRLGPRVTYTGALLVWSVASLAGAGVSSAGAMFGPRLLLGVGEAPFIPAGVRTLSDWLPRAERGLASGVFISGVALGSAIGPPVLGSVVSAYGWRAGFLVTAAISLVVAVVWFTWYRAPEADRRLSAAERALIAADQEPAEHEAAAPWRVLVRHRDVWALTAGYFCLLYILYTFVSWVPGYLVADRHMTLLGSGFATSIPWLCAFVVTILSGRLADVAVRRGLRVSTARKAVLVGGMIAALAIVGTALTGSSVVAIVCLSISTSGISAANGACWAATQDVARRSGLAGSAAGFVNGVANVGGLLGPVVTGFLAYATHSFVVPLVVAAGLALAGALVWQVGIRSAQDAG